MAPVTSVTDKHVADFAAALAHLIQKQNETRAALAVERNEFTIAQEAFFRGQVSNMGSIMASLGIKEIVRAKAMEIINANTAMAAQC